MEPRYRAEIISNSISLILSAIGEDVDRDGLKETPERVARMYREYLCGYEVDIAALLRTFEHERNGSEAMVIEKDIPFYSMCEHHMIPFFGEAHVGYIPAKGKVAGLSKLARVVDAFGRRLQMQERMTDQIADALVEHLSEDVMVVVEAEHLCMSARGIQKPGAKTITSAVRGKLKDSVNARSEFLSLIRR